jgi:hypothetical protein
MSFNGENPDQLVEYKKILLEKIQVGIRKEKIYPVDLDLKVMTDYTAKTIVADLRAFFWSKPVQREVLETQVPRSWWDAFKKAYFPEWLLKRFPITWEKIFTKVETIYVYPQMDVVYPGATMEMVTWEGYKGSVSDFDSTEKDRLWKENELLIFKLQAAENAAKYWQGEAQKLANFSGFYEGLNIVEAEDPEPGLVSSSAVEYWKNRALLADDYLADVDHEKEKENK